MLLEERSKVARRLPGEHVQLAHNIARSENPYRARLTGEVVDHLHLAFEDDHEIAGGVACPKKDLPDLRLPRPPIAPEEFDLVLGDPTSYGRYYLLSKSSE